MNDRAYKGDKYVMIVLEFRGENCTGKINNNINS